MQWRRTRRTGSGRCSWGSRTRCRGWRWRGNRGSWLRCGNRRWSWRGGGRRHWLRDRRSRSRRCNWSRNRRISHCRGWSWGLCRDHGRRWRRRCWCGRNWCGRGGPACCSLCRRFFRGAFRLRGRFRVRYSLQMTLNLFRHIGGDRARVRLPFGYSKTRQKINDSFRFDLEFACEFVNADLVCVAHAS